MPAKPGPDQEKLAKALRLPAQPVAGREDWEGALAWRETHWDFPGGPVAKTQCRRPGFLPDSGN